MRPGCRRASDWFMIACLCVFTGNTNCNMLVQFKKTENSHICWQGKLLGNNLHVALIGPMDG